ncbi:MAG: 4-hydroxythreonine-4-phosphate dehydrogenase PdxA [Pseudomonadota bacterium]
MTSDPPLPLAVTLGDPAGCGPAITGKAWRALHSDPAHLFAAIGPRDAFEAHAPTVAIDHISEAGSVFKTALPVLDIGLQAPLPAAGTPDAASAGDILASIRTATALVQNQEAAAVVTNPINKALLYESGFSHPGHTEFLASLCAGEDAPLRPVMMLVGGGLRVALATIHEPLVQAATNLSTDTLIDIGRITHGALKRDFGLKTPRIAFSGLNPHAGENGSLGVEEAEVINPAARQLRAEGIDISDARSADTVFAEALAGKFDAVIAMTHDQGLIPVKTLDFWGGVNVTLGLPIVRTSPDHGTAYEAAGDGSCRADSLIAAIGLAAQIAKHRSNG